MSLPGEILPRHEGQPADGAPNSGGAGSGVAVLRRTAEKRRRRRLLLGAAAVLAAAGSGGAWTMLVPRRGPLDGVLLATVGRGNVEDTITALGHLQPREFVDVGAQVSGQLKRLDVQVGQKVAAGTLLAEIDPTVMRAKVDSSRAEIRALRAQLREQQAAQDLAQRQFRRQSRMMRENATSAEAYDTAQAGLRSAEARIAQLKADIDRQESSLKADEATLGYTRIYAPMAGTVVSITAQQGQTLNAAHTIPIILRLADLSSMTVRTQVSEADVSKLHPGMDVYFTTLGNRRRRWRSKLRQILPAPEVVNNVVLYTALFDVDNSGGELMAEMSAQVFFVLSAAHNVVTVPVSALRRTGEDGVYRVSVARNDETIERRRVRIGVRNRIRAEVLSGLKPGEQVVAGRNRDPSERGNRRQRRRRFRL